MSGSPKYTTAALRAQAAANVARQQRDRDAARRAAQAVARQAALQLRAVRVRSRLAAVGTRLDSIEADAQRVGLAAEVHAVRVELTAAGRLGRAPGEKALDDADRSVARLESSVARLGRSVAEGLALKQRQDAVAAVRAQLAASAQRTAFDPEGAAQVDGLLAQADSADAGPAFVRAFSLVTTHVSDHLAAAAANQAAFEHAKSSAQDAGDSLNRILVEADGAGVSLAEAWLAQAAVGRLDQVLGGAWPGAGALTAAARDLKELEEANQGLAEELEDWLSRLDRVAAVAQAVIAAAPRAGLRIVQDSLVRDGDRVMFRTTRADDQSTLDVDVAPADSDGVAIAYHGSGIDFRTECAAEGDVKRCDLTEEILSGLHAELKSEGVETDGLRWTGKPTRVTNTVQTWTAVKERGLQL